MRRFLGVVVAAGLTLPAAAGAQVSLGVRLGWAAAMGDAQYSKQKVENTVDPSQNFDGSIPDKAVHEWLQLGVRGRFDP